MCDSSKVDNDAQLSVTSDLIVKPDVDLSKASRTRQILAALTVSLGAFAIGNCFGWSSPVQLQLQIDSPFNPYNGQEDSPWYMALTPHEISWTGSLVNTGALVGATFSGVPMARYGRRYTLMSTCIPFVIGWLLISFAVHISMVYAGRILCGFAGGMCFTVVPAYNNEVSTPNVRGVTGFFFTLNIAFGVLFTSILGLFLHWRTISIIGVTPSIVLLLGMLFVPESPIFLIGKERRKEALDALKRLRGTAYDCDRELEVTEAFIKKNDQKSVGFRDFKRPEIHKPILMGVFLMIIQQLAGFNATAFYSAEIFQLAGSDINPLLCTVIVNSVTIVACVLGAVAVDKVPRRVLFGVSETISCLALTALGVYFYFMERKAASMANIGWVPLLLFIVNTIVVGCGLSPIPWVVSSEVLPVRFRGPGSAVIAFTNRLMSFLITKTFVDLQTSLSTAGTFWFYGSCCFIGALFALLIMPETKGKTSEEIRQFFMEC